MHLPLHIKRTLKCDAVYTLDGQWLNKPFRAEAEFFCDISYSETVAHKLLSDTPSNTMCLMHSHGHVWIFTSFINIWSSASVV